jgi:hypothetical protein
MDKLMGGRFVVTVESSGCVERIEPRVGEVRTKLTTIGAIADETSQHVEKMSQFFDPQVRGDCVVHDLTEGRWASLRRGQALPGCELVQTWQREDDHWEWVLTLQRLEGASRELRVDLTIPMPIFPGPPGSGHSRWHLWAPVSEAPFGDDYGIKTFHHAKCMDESTDIPLPLCCLFNPSSEADLGLAFLLPPDQMRYVDFQFNQRDWLTTVTFHNVAAVAGQTPRLRLWLFDHEGDWRPALGWARRMFPALLGPAAGQEKIDGNMAYTVPVTRRQIAAWSQKMRLKWNELVLYHDFGNYAPDEPFDASQFKTPEHPEWSHDGLTYDEVNRYVDMCHRHGVSVMPYFNLTDGESEIAERFPDAVARSANGEGLVTWNYYNRRQFCVLMNCDPQYSWFEFIMSQYETLVQRVPQIDGFFFDQTGYGWIDTAHFDGETFWQGRPAYNLGHMYVRAFREVRRRFPRPRFVGMGNGVCRWQLLEFVDGAMAEGTPSFLGGVSPMCPERPVMCLAEGEYAFQNALLYGAWLHVSPYYRYPSTAPLPADAVRLFKAYNPLFEFLEGRKWVYAARPLQVEFAGENAYVAPLLHPHGSTIRANLFETPTGDYVVVVGAIPRGVMSGGGFLAGVSVKVRAPGLSPTWQALLFGPDYRGYRVREVEPAADGYLEIGIPRHGAATMIVLTRSLAELRGRRAWLKLRERALE